MPTFPLGVVLWWASANSRCMPNLKLLASAVTQILKGNPKIFGRSSSPWPCPLFPLDVILWWPLANPSCTPNLKSLASVVAEILEGKPQILGSSPSQGPHPLFLLHCVWKKRCHFIFDYNSRISWWIFIIFIPLETRMNAPQSHVIYLLKILMTS